MRVLTVFAPYFKIYTDGRMSAEYKAVVKHAVDINVLRYYVVH